MRYMQKRIKDCCNNAAKALLFTYKDIPRELLIQIGCFVIYSVMVTPDYFVLEGREAAN